MTTDKKKSAYNRMADKLDRIGLAAPAVSLPTTCWSRPVWNGMRPPPGLRSWSAS